MGKRTWYSSLRVVVLAASFLLVSDRAMAADAGGPTRTFDITVNPLALLFGTFNADFYYGVSDSIAVGLSGSYFGYSLGTTSLKAFGVGAKMLYYFNGVRFSDGWFVSPNVDLLPFSYTDSLGSVSFTGFAFGAIAGYHWVWDSGFNILLGGGLNVYTVGSTVTANNRTITVPAFTGVAPALNFSLGYAW